MIEHLAPAIKAFYGFFHRSFGQLRLPDSVNWIGLNGKITHVFTNQIYETRWCQEFGYIGDFVR